MVAASFLGHLLGGASVAPARCPRRCSHRSPGGSHPHAIYRLVASLLSSGADPKAAALDGKTALSIGKAGKSREAARLLQRAMAL